MKNNILTKPKLIEIGIGIVSVIILIVLDQVTKQVAGNYQPIGKVFIPEIITFTYVENNGAAFGMFGDNPVLLWVFSIISLVLIGYLFLTYDLKKKKVYSLSLIFIAAGAIGNLLDRLFMGYVIDFLNYPFLDFLGQFGGFSNNFADLFLTAGLVMIFIHLLFLDKTFFKRKKIDNTTEESKPEDKA